jgi:hypothetical protein
MNSKKIKPKRWEGSSIRRTRVQRASARAAARPSLAQDPGPALTGAPPAPAAPCPPGGARSVLPELSRGVKLLNVVEGWLRAEKAARHARDAEKRATGGGAVTEPKAAPSRTPFDMPSKHLAFFR